MRGGYDADRQGCGAQAGMSRTYTLLASACWMKSEWGFGATTMGVTWSWVARLSIWDCLRARDMWCKFGPREISTTMWLRLTP